MSLASSPLSWRHRSAFRLPKDPDYSSSDAGFHFPLRHRKIGWFPNASRIPTEINASGPPLGVGEGIDPTDIEGALKVLPKRPELEIRDGLRRLLLVVRPGQISKGR